jgi:hypothetical protein
VSFDVDSPGIPVLVKVSYFPSWQVSGGKGPYRVAPNLMVVIPTSHHVSVHYGYTPVDGVGYLLGLMGLFGLVYMVRSKPLVFAPPRVRPAGLRGEEPLADPYIRLQQELAFAMRPADDGHQIDEWLGLPGGTDGGGVGSDAPAWGIYPPSAPIRDTAGPVRFVGTDPATDAAPGDIGANPPGWTDDGLGAEGLGKHPPADGADGPGGRRGRADPGTGGTGGGGSSGPG